jgi:hypothetical protein
MDNFSEAAHFTSNCKNFAHLHQEPLSDTENYCQQPFIKASSLWKDILCITGWNIALASQKNNFNLFVFFHFQLKQSRRFSKNLHPPWPTEHCDKAHHKPKLQWLYVDHWQIKHKLTYMYEQLSTGTKTCFNVSFDWTYILYNSHRNYDTRY